MGGHLKQETAEYCAAVCVQEEAGILIQVQVQVFLFVTYNKLKWNVKGSMLHTVQK